MNFLTTATSQDALRKVQDCGALDEIEGALRASYEATATGPKGRLNPSSVVVKKLRKLDWRSGRVWAPSGLLKDPNDQFDGWKCFAGSDGTRLGVAAEIEWSWNRVYFDFLKFWRGVQGGQIEVGVEVLRGPSSFRYAVEHQYRLYEDLIPDVPIVFCALDAEDLVEADYEASPRRYAAFPMPTPGASVESS